MTGPQSKEMPEVDLEGQPNSRLTVMHWLDSWNGVGQESLGRSWACNGYARRPFLEQGRNWIE